VALGQVKVGDPWFKAYSGVRKTERMGKLVRPRHRWDDNI
jgi:hypothetical protein